VEEAVVYGTGGTLDGGQVDLLLDLAVPDTGTDGPRPLFVHIHGGSFQTGNRASQFNVAERGWVAASIDYRLAGDEPLPGLRVKPFFDAVGGESSSARNRSVVGSMEDTLVALDYLLSRADELNIDTDRIVLKGESAGAFIALSVAYCADKFENSGPRIAAVIDFAGGISEIFCGGGTAIDPDEAAVFIAHGTADATVSFTDRALSIVDGATAAGITYELHPLEGVGHDWLLGLLGQTNADGRKIDDLMYEFLDRVLYGEYVSTTTATTPSTSTAPTTITTKPSGFPRVCQAWAGIQNRPDLSELEQFASHDLMWSGLWDLGLAWRVSGDQPHQGLSTTLMDIWGNPDAAEERKASLLQLNPDFKFLVSVLYREGKYVDDESGLVNLWEFGDFPPDSPFWIRDAVGEPVPAFGFDDNLDGVIEPEEIVTSLLDFRNPDLIELVAQKALALEQTGVVDGVFLDWWAEHNRTAASYIDWSTFYMTAEEEIEARLAILRRIRELVSDDFLILGNTNQLTAPRSAPYMNGMYMEAVKADRFGGYTVSELETIEESLYWGSENLRQPRINCLEGWRVVHDYGEDDDDALVAERDSAENKQWMRLITTLTLTHSDGHVLFAGNPISSHAHNWYDFWDADLGQPVGDKRQLLDGVEDLFIREFTNGYAVYNRSGTSQTISLSNDVTAVSTGLVADTHQLGDLDGEIYLGPTSGTPAG
jgi:acetyl esterase/lipase